MARRAKIGVGDAEGALSTGRKSVSRTRRAVLSGFLAMSCLLLFLGCLGNMYSGEIDTVGFYLQPGESAESKCPELQDMCRTWKARNLNLLNVAPIDPRAPAIVATSSKKVSCAQILQSADCRGIGKDGWTSPGQGPDAGTLPAPGGAAAVYQSSKASIYQTVAEDCAAIQSRCTGPGVQSVQVIPRDDPGRAVTLPCADLLDKPYCRTVLDKLSRSEAQ
jgi:hypothetical protein